MGCQRWKTGCYGCPQKREYPASLLLDNSKANYEKKKALFTGIPNLTLVTPSHWLENLVRQSFLGEYPVEVIYNQINREIMANGIGHHWMVGYGDFHKELERFCKIKGIRYYEI